MPKTQEARQQIWRSGDSSSLSRNRATRNEQPRNSTIERLSAFLESLTGPIPQSALKRTLGRRHHLCLAGKKLMAKGNENGLQECLFDSCS